MQLLFSYLDKLLYWIVGAMILVLAAVGFAGVVFRYVLQSSLFWADEFLRYWDIWLIFLGAALATRHGSLITVDIFTGLLPYRARHYLEAAVHAVATLFLIAMIWFSWELVTRSSGGVSAAMRVPMDRMYMVFPVGMGLMAINCLRQAVERFKEASRGKPAVTSSLEVPDLQAHPE
ncbi:MAG: TRAP transporter small permease [Chloroflexi bacterium]|nr:TRAP transporter small permease [Chloroflexota bacterium]